MELNKAIDKYFSRNKLIDSICKYQLYYQIGLGNVALESFQDLQDTVKKLNELDLHVTSEKIIFSIYKIILRHSDDDNFEEKFDQYLKDAALTNMLDNFIKEDKDFVNSKPYKDMVLEKIKNDTFFNTNMKQQLELDYNAILPAMELNISEEIVNIIKNNITDMFNQYS